MLVCTFVYNADCGKLWGQAPQNATRDHSRKVCRPSPRRARFGRESSFISITCLAHHCLPRLKCLMEGLCLVRAGFLELFTALEVDGLRAEAFCHSAPNHWIVFQKELPGRYMEGSSIYSKRKSGTYHSGPPLTCYKRCKPAIGVSRVNGTSLGEVLSSTPY
jgi:hypothetical protein